MRLGVIDVGSNTVHLLVVDAHPGASPDPYHSERSTLRLMRYLDADGAITEEGVR
ncbi:MAG: Ppx/GppA family phosphatase, partial [Leucobacter sp.]